MRFIELFAGIGGFRLGLESVGCLQQTIQKGQGNEGIKKQRGVFNGRQFTCVWSNDNDRYACQIYRKQFGEVHEGDIRTVDPSAIPEHDLLCAGFPCQSFSIAGKRGGFEDTRGALFFEICRIARAKKTKYLFLENVDGLLSASQGEMVEVVEPETYSVVGTNHLGKEVIATHYTGRWVKVNRIKPIPGTKGQVFSIILQSLDELGYDCQWQVLNSKDFGVPQNRERVFIIGHLRGQSRPKVFPIQATDGVHNETANAIDANYHKGWLDHGQRTIIANAVDVDGYLRFGQRPRDGNGKPQLLPIGYRRIRRLTPIECERLQGFPDNWTEGISDMQRYKCLGNAVTVNVIEAIGRQWAMK